MIADQTRDVLYDMLLFKRNALEQLVIVSTVFGAFSVGGLVALLVAPTRDRLRSYLFVMLCIASLAFIFGTAVDAVILPGMHRSPDGLDAIQIRGLLDLGEVPIWSVLIGSFALIAAIAGFGFTFSKRLGWSVLALAFATLVAFGWCVMHLAKLLG